MTKEDLDLTNIDQGMVEYIRDKFNREDVLVYGGSHIICNSNGVPLYIVDDNHQLYVLHPEEKAFKLYNPETDSKDKIYAINDDLKVRLSYKYKSEELYGDTFKSKKLKEFVDYWTINKKTNKQGDVFTTAVIIKPSQDIVEILVAKVLNDNKVTSPFKPNEPMLIDFDIMSYTIDINKEMSFNDLNKLINDNIDRILESIGAENA